MLSEQRLEVFGLFTGPSIFQEKTLSATPMQR
jgi:hypothetical protein